MNSSMIGVDFLSLISYVLYSNHNHLHIAVLALFNFTRLLRKVKPYNCLEICK
ncbi:hypothetical protein HMPREF1982_00181 [Clostridiales bacterium oral taxon 876 str. F0540]|nr:hypothetical protein HMPREF1982_00181 [Clostridiales bacterium oral taxon 876 str. F0540]